MYCIECGAEIPDKSKFCSNCGKLQNYSESSSKEKIIENDIMVGAIFSQKSILDYHFLRKTFGWYIAWVFIHLGLLLIYTDGIFKAKNMRSENFWPFIKYLSSYESSLEYYDITEFIVYTISSVIILLIFNMSRSYFKNRVK